MLSGVTERDPEGEALEAEIAADRRNDRLRRRRFVLFAPPLVGLVVAAGALSAARPREVYGARAAIASAPAGEPLRFRAVLVRAVPGGPFDEGPIGVRPATGASLRVRGPGGIVGRAEPTDEDGAAEIVIDPPVPPVFSLEADVGGFREVARIGLAGEAKPQVIARTITEAHGDLTIEIAPEGSVVAPPLPGALWVRVRDGKGAPAAGADVRFEAESGLAGDPAEVTTDGAGLARVPITPVATPVIVQARGRLGALSGRCHAVLGAVRGVAIPEGDGFVAGRELTLLSPSSREVGYADLFRDGVRVGGARLRFSAGRARMPLPGRGVFALETRTGPDPIDDVAYVATVPIVVADDPVDGFAYLRASTRVPAATSPSGGLSGYRPALAASIAFAPAMIMAPPVAADGLARALSEERRRGKAVRRAAGGAIVGAGVAELGLMVLLGAFARPPNAIDAMRDLGEEPAPAASISRSDRTRLAGIVACAIGIVVLLFSALVTMAWGLP
jgi:hypothetical protein